MKKIVVGKSKKRPSYTKGKKRHLKALSSGMDLGTHGNPGIDRETIHRTTDVHREDTDS